MKLKVSVSYAFIVVLPIMHEANGLRVLRKTKTNPTPTAPKAPVPTPTRVTPTKPTAPTPRTAPVTRPIAVPTAPKAPVPVSVPTAPKAPVRVTAPTAPKAPVPVSAPTAPKVPVLVSAPITPKVPVPVPVVAPIPRAVPVSAPAATPTAPIVPAPIPSAPIVPPTPVAVPAPRRTASPTVFPTLQPQATPVVAPTTIVSAPTPISSPSESAPTASKVCVIPQITSNTWWSTPPSPYPITVAEAQGSLIGTDFVIFSGFKNGYSMATTETYALDMSVVNAQWRRMDDMPFPEGITHLGIAVNGMKAYLCGGYVGGSLGTHTPNCYIYDHSKPAGTGEQWTPFDPLPDGGRSGGGMIYDTATNALVYAAGSQRPIAFQKSAVDFPDTWMFSLSNPSTGWVSKANIPFTGNHMNFVTAYDGTGKERHYFFGGQSGEDEEGGNTATMYEYVATNNTWIQRKSMPFPRGHSAAASRAVNCGFIVAGGRTNTGLTEEITYYDIGTDTWTAIGTLPVQIHTNVCVIYKEMLRCETGWAEGTFSSERPLKLG